MQMLQFLLKLLFLVLLARLVVALLRLVRRDGGREIDARGGGTRRVRSASDLGEDIVDADFEDISRKPEP
jgi:hypothetical protein